MSEGEESLSLAVQVSESVYRKETESPLNLFTAVYPYYSFPSLHQCHLKLFLSDIFLIKSGYMNKSGVCIIAVPSLPVSLDEYDIWCHFLLV